MLLRFLFCMTYLEFLFFLFSYLFVFYFDVEAWAESLLAELNPGLFVCLEISLTKLPCYLCWAGTCSFPAADFWAAGDTSVHYHTQFGLLLNDLPSGLKLDDSTFYSFIFIWSCDASFSILNILISSSFPIISLLWLSAILFYFSEFFEEMIRFTDDIISFLCTRNWTQDLDFAR